MKYIFIVDYIGIHCGMHYYLEAFKKKLEQIKHLRVAILSNYSDGNEKPFFLYQYHGNRIQKGLALLRNLFRFKRFVASHRDDIFIYLTYGNPIDIPFINIVTKAPNHIIDIHEAIAQNVDSNESLKSRFNKLYSQEIRTVISHSERTDKFLKEFESSALRFRVPHFKYVFPKEFDSNKVASEVVEAVNHDRINFLFFGNLNESKGVDLLIEAINRLPENIAQKANFIIAGKDFDGAIDRVDPLRNRDVKIIKRHITDDELRFLFQNIDYLTLPYRKTSQSGILETAFYFKKPIIASDIPYFRKTLNEFPSFGVLSEETSIGYSNSLRRVIENHSTVHYFSEEEYAKYENRKEVEEFIKSFEDWIKK